MVRGETPRRTRIRERKREREITYVKAMRDRRARIAILVVHRKRNASRYHPVKRFVYNVANKVMAKWAQIVANVELPIVYTRCQTQKLKLKTFNYVNAINSRIYQVYQEAKARIVKVLTPVGKYVVSRRGVRVIGNYLRWTVETLLALWQRWRKTLDDRAQSMAKLTDRFVSWLEKTKYGRPLFMLLLSVSELARAIQELRGWLEDWELVIDADCSPYYYPRGYVRLPWKPLPYVVARIRDELSERFVHECPRNDRWCREYRAMWAKDILSVCDARLASVIGICIDRAVQMMYQDWQNTNYYRAYEKMAGC